MGLLKTEGIVTKTTKYSETSLIVTVITRDFGKISAIANNVRSSKSHMLMGLQLFSFSEIVFYESRSKTGLYKLNEMSVIESFGNIRNDLEKLAYASYFAEVANSAVSEDNPDEEILRLLLNTLFALDRDLCPKNKIKTVFEWRIAAMSGYEPDVEACVKCGCVQGDMLLCFSEGEVFCESCGGEKTDCGRVSEGMRRIIKYICEAESKRIFSFDANDAAIEYLGLLGERYIQRQFDKKFSTLDYLKKVLSAGM
ncbi:MAG: DNA repair protein RecO [Clostridia bacterium]|nr:DNA repair protein RecO [Clostridia bacterium]